MRSSGAEPTSKQIALQSLQAAGRSLVPVEISAIGIVDENGEFAGIHGSARDISERDPPRARAPPAGRRAGGGEERAHLARELHDSVTQALFSMTLVTRIDRAAARPRRRTPPGAADPAARPPARGARRDARAHLRAAAGQSRAGRASDAGAPDPHGGAPGPDRPAGRRRERPHGATAARARGGRFTGSPRRPSTTS